MQVLDRTHVRVTLAKTSAGWIPEGEEEASALYVTNVNTGAGMMSIGKASFETDPSSRRFLFAG